MSEDHPSPFPTALLLDTSFLRTIGGTESDAYQTFVRYVKAEGVSGEVSLDGEAWRQKQRNGFNRYK